MPSVPILIYHKVAEPPPGVRYPDLYVQPRDFARQLALLRAAGYQAISLPQYVAYRRGEGELPSRPVAITFDDGYLSNYEIALPLLQQYGFSATVFVPSSLIGRTNVWDPDEIQEPLVGLEHIRAMQRAGIEFQSHTCTHVRLPALPPAEALRELRESRVALEQVLGAPVCAIAYPWGDHDAAVQELAAEAGYDAGLILRRRANFDHTPLLGLRRIEVSQATTLRRFAWDLLRLPWTGD